MGRPEYWISMLSEGAVFHVLVAYIRISTVNSASAHPGMNHHGHVYYNPHTPPANGSASHAQVPTANELERHYYELGEQRRRLEEMLEKTDRMMAGVKRGLDEMRAGQAQAQGGQGSGSQGQQSQQSPSQAAAVPISRPERPRSRESVWPVAPPESTTRD